MDLSKADALIDDNKNLADAIWVPSSSYVNSDESSTENQSYEQLFRVLSKLMVAYHEHDQDNELDGSAPIRRSNFWKRSNFWRKRANFWKRDLAWWT